MKTKIKANLENSLSRFGDEFEILNNGVGKPILGRSWVNSRVSRHWGLQNLRLSIFASKPALDIGNIIYDKSKDERYFIYSNSKESVAGNTVFQKATLLRINAECKILRPIENAGLMGGVKLDFEENEKILPCHIRELNADLRAERPALSERANFLLYLHYKTGVNILDRIVLNKINYQVESINKIDFEGLLEVALSLDKRERQ